MTFLTQAIVYNTVKNEVVGTITANQASLKPNSLEKTIFYCSECYNQHRHHVRLKLMPIIRKMPPHFDLLNRKNSTHQCTLPVRYNEIEKLAERYNAIERAENSYIFDMSFPCDVPKDIPENMRVVDKASRLMKITYALMYDPELRSQQYLNINGVDIPFDEAFFDASPKGKLALYNKSLKLSPSDPSNQIATIFRSAGRRVGLWKRGKEQNLIPGIGGAYILNGGVKMQISTELKCASQEIYNGFYQLVGPADYNNSRPFIVFGRAVKDRMGARTRIFIDHLDQVQPWDHHVSFDDAIKEQVTEFPIRDNQLALI